MLQKARWPVSVTYRVIFHPMWVEGEFGNLWPIGDVVSDPPHEKPDHDSSEVVIQYLRFCSFSTPAVFDIWPWENLPLPGVRVWSHRLKCTRWTFMRQHRTRPFYCTSTIAPVSSFPPIMCVQSQVHNSSWRKAISRNNPLVYWPTHPLRSTLFRLIFSPWLKATQICSITHLEWRQVMEVAANFGTVAALQ